MSYEKNRGIGTLSINLDLKRRIQKQAKDEGRAMVRVVEQALRDYLNRKKPDRVIVMPKGMPNIKLPAMYCD